MSAYFSCPEQLAEKSFWWRLYTGRQSWTVDKIHWFCTKLKYILKFLTFFNDFSDQAMILIYSFHLFITGFVYKCNSFTSVTIKWCFLVSYVWQAFPKLEYLKGVGIKGGFTVAITVFASKHQSGCISSELLQWEMWFAWT